MAPHDHPSVIPISVGQQPLEVARPLDHERRCVVVEHPVAIPTTDAIRVAGHLDDHWSTWLGGHTVSQSNGGSTSIVVEVRDQAEPHGLLVRLRDIGATPSSTCGAPDGRRPGASEFAVRAARQVDHAWGTRTRRPGPRTLRRTGPSIRGRRRAEGGCSAVGSRDRPPRPAIDWLQSLQAAGAESDATSQTPANQPAKPSRTTP